MAWVQCFLICVIFLTVTGSEDNKVEAGIPQCPHAIFGFGDSLSDTGEVLRAFPAAVLSGNKPYGTTFPGYPTGRYSDGKLVIDFIANAFRFPLLNPYFDSLGADFKHGVNFAVAGATARKTPIQVPFFLSAQVDQAIFFHNSILQVPHRPNVRVPTYGAGLYYIHIGGNDVNYDLLAGTELDVIRRITAPETASNISAAISRLYTETTARQFLVLNIPPIGCSTFALTLFKEVPGAGPIDASGCLSGINALVQDFNSQIRAAVEGERQRHKDAAIVYADLYKIYLDVSMHYGDYGFEEPFKACCGSPTGPYNYDPKVVCGMPGVTACSNPSEYINWDGVHFTEAVYRRVASSILKGEFLDPAVDFAAICGLVGCTGNKSNNSCFNEAAAKH